VRAGQRIMVVVPTPAQEAQQPTRTPAPNASRVPPQPTTPAQHCVWRARRLQLKIALKLRDEYSSVMHLDAPAAAPRAGPGKWQWRGWQWRGWRLGAAAVATHPLTGGFSLQRQPLAGCSSAIVHPNQRCQPPHVRVPGSLVVLAPTTSTHYHTHYTHYTHHTLTTTHYHTTITHNLLSWLPPCAQRLFKVERRKQMERWAGPGTRGGTW